MLVERRALNRDAKTVPEHPLQPKSGSHGAVARSPAEKILAICLFHFQVRVKFGRPSETLQVQNFGGECE
jgi:hypothetical protein